MEYAVYPFSVNGVKFVSRLAVNGSMYATVERMHESIFAQMNTEAILELMGNPANMTLNEIKIRLYELNEGATQALIELEA